MEILTTAAMAATAGCIDTDEPPHGIWRLRINMLRFMNTSAGKARACWFVQACLLCVRTRAFCACY